MDHHIICLQGLPAVLVHPLIWKIKVRSIIEELSIKLRILKGPLQALAEYIAELNSGVDGTSCPPYHTFAGNSRSRSGPPSDLPGSSSLGGMPRHSPPPHHRHAGTTRCAEIRDSLQANRRSRASESSRREYKPRTSKSLRPPKPPRPSKPSPSKPPPSKPPRPSKSTASESSSAAKKKSRRAHIKICPDPSAAVHEEWTRLHADANGEAPVMELVAPFEVVDEEDSSVRWRCPFSHDDESSNLKAGLTEAEARRHTVTHYPNLGLLCANPSCGSVFSRIDALHRHYNPNRPSTPPICKRWDTHLPDKNFRVFTGADGQSKVIRIRWVAASSVVDYTF